MLPGCCCFFYYKIEIVRSILIKCNKIRNNCFTSFIIDMWNGRLSIMLGFGAIELAMLTFTTRNAFFFKKKAFNKIFSN